jgi:acetyl esterase/lipase
MQIAAAMMMIACGSACADDLQQEIRVWPSTAPGSEHWVHQESKFSFAESEKWTQKDHASGSSQEKDSQGRYSETEAPPSAGIDPSGQEKIRNVVIPTLSVFPADPGKSNGTGVIICPGGGLWFLSWTSEGTDVARWLAQRGFTAFVLKYRVMQTPSDNDAFAKQLSALINDVARRSRVPLSKRPKSLMEMMAGNREHANARQLADADAKRAVMLIRQRAADWKLSPEQIGMLGFSAGAFLTTDVVLENDPESQLAFAGIIYGGEMNGRAVPAAAPSLFAVIAQDDPLVAPALLENVYQKWSSAGRPAELHVFARGGHGFGATRRGLPVDSWMDLLGRWLEDQQRSGRKRHFADANQNETSMRYASPEP